MGIILGLGAALFWGAADFLARNLTQIIGTYRTLFFMQFIGAFILSIYVLASGEAARLAHHVSWQPWLWAGIVAVTNVFGALALYRSFEVGVLSIVSPIAASSTALTVVLSFLSGETLSQARAFGLGAALLGVVLAATHFSTIPHDEIAGKTRRRGRLTRGVGWALVASVSYGINFWMLGFFVTPYLGGSVPIWILRLGTISTLALIAAPARQSITSPTRPRLVAYPGRRHTGHLRLPAGEFRLHHRTNRHRQRPCLALQRRHRPAGLALLAR